MPLARMAILAALLFSATTVSGQPPAKKDDKSDPLEKFEPKGAPGAGQKFLSKFVGDWNVTKTFYPRTEGAEPTKLPGTCKQEMIQEGRFLKSDFVFEGTKGKTTGTGVIGFESPSGLFTSTWIDSRQTKMSFRRSPEKFDGKQIVLHGVAFEEVKDGRKSKTVTKLENDGNTIVHRQFSIAADGTERAVMQLEMTRKPAK